MNNIIRKRIFACDGKILYKDYDNQHCPYMTDVSSVNFFMKDGQRYNLISVIYNGLNELTYDLEYLSDNEIEVH